MAQKGAECLELDWKALFKLLGGRGSDRALLNLRSARPGAYVGVLKTGTNFVLECPPGIQTSTSLRWLLKQRPDFADTVDRIYRVEEADWGASLFEGGSP